VKVGWSAWDLGHETWHTFVTLPWECAVDVAVNRVAAVGGPESLRVVVAQSPIVDVFRKTVNVVVLFKSSIYIFIASISVTDLDHVRHQLQKLIFINDNVPISREQLLAITRPRNLKLKRRLIRPRQRQIAVPSSRLAIPLRLHYERRRQNVLRAVLGRNMLGVDLHVETVFALVLDLERQVVDVVAISLAMRAREREVGREAAGGVLGVGGRVARALLCIGGHGVVDSRGQAGSRVDLRAQCWDDALGGACLGWRGLDEVVKMRITNLVYLRRATPTSQQHLLVS